MLVVKKYKDGWYRGIRCRGYQVSHDVGQVQNTGLIHRSLFYLEYRNKPKHSLKLTLGLKTLV